MFDTQYLRKFTDWFSCTWLFFIYIWTRLYRNFVSESLRSGYHGKFKNIFILFLIITFIIRFYNLSMFSRHICSYIAMLLKNGSTTMVTICYFSCSDCKTPIRTTHCCSNNLMVRIEYISLVNSHWFDTLCWSSSSHIS